MPHRVYEVRTGDRAKLDAALADDTVSRQSITVKDASHFGFTDRASLFVFVEGEEKFLHRADALILEFARRAPEGDEVYAKLKAEEDEAASGLGFIMGG